MKNMLPVKFNKHCVVNTTTKVKARVNYSLDNRIDGKKCVTIYARDYDRKLGKIFDDECYTNNTDTMTDYFDKGKIILFENHSLYEMARERVENIIIDRG